MNACLIRACAGAGKVRKTGVTFQHFWVRDLKIVGMGRLGTILGQFVSFKWMIELVWTFFARVYCFE